MVLRDRKIQAPTSFRAGLARLQGRVRVIISPFCTWAPSATQGDKNGEVELTSHIDPISLITSFNTTQPGNFSHSIQIHY
jgi:hypothetical protein